MGGIKKIGPCRHWSELAELTPLPFSLSLKIPQLKRRWPKGDATDCRSTSRTRARTCSQSSGQVQNEATYMGAHIKSRAYEKMKKTRIKQAKDFGIEVGGFADRDGLGDLDP